MLPIPHVGRSAPPVLLSQPWRKTPERGFQHGRVSLHWSDTHLHLQVELEDRHFSSQSTAHNQPLHALGDVVEVFLMLPGAPQYYELQVSPHNHRAFLRWPLHAIEKVRAGELQLADFRENPDACDSRVQLLENGWEVHLDIPKTVLDLEEFAAGQKCALSVCRYDYRAAGSVPILSTIALHAEKNFHRYQDWPPFGLV